MPRLFTNEKKLVVDLEALEQEALACLQKMMAERESYEAPRAVSREDFWYWLKGTDWGSHELHHPATSLAHMYDRPYLHSPWAEELSQVKPPRRPRVLFVGTGTEVSTLRSRAHKQEFRDALEKHGIKRRRWSRCGGAVHFWSKFFDADAYLTKPRSVPTLILMTGLIRSTFHNTGSTECVGEIIATHAAHWNIPVVRVTSTSR